jgi:hypothetical protein
MGEKSELRKLVRDFSAEMREKLLAKADRGWRGWNATYYREIFRSLLVEHVSKGDWVDVANFAAFLWYLDQRAPKRPLARGEGDG